MRHRVIALTLAPTLLTISCGTRAARRAVIELPPVVTPVAPPEDKDADEDSYREAAEFYLLKRVAPGQELPVERYLQAKQHVERMPRYSVGERRFVAHGAAAPGVSVGNWQPLGPGN